MGAGTVPAVDEKERLAVVRRLIADPPQIHTISGPGQTPAPAGVWSTDHSCYEFIASVCRPGFRTLETGIGLSTVLFALISGNHTCVAPFQVEADNVLAYLADHDIPHDHLTIHIQWSEDVLPQLKPTPLDLVFIDGGHAYPIPVIDWFYTAPRLVEGGALVVDDRQLPAVSEGLLQFLDRDSQWRSAASTAKWCAYYRATGGDLREDWADQHERGMFQFPPDPKSSVRARLGRALGRG